MDVVNLDTLHDCLSMGSLVFNKVVIRDPQTFKYHFSDIQPIQRFQGETLVDAVERIQSTRAAGSPGKVQFATMESAVKNFFDRNSGQLEDNFEDNDYDSQDEEDDEDDFQEAHWKQ